MPPDISYSIVEQVTRGNLNRQMAASGVTADMATSGIVGDTLSLGTATQSISTASLTAVGVCFARNLATTGTHTVSFGRLDGTALWESVTLRAGEAALFRMSSGNYAAKAAVAGTRLEYQITEG